MARQLPALVSDSRSLNRIGAPTSTVSRMLATVAPDVIRAAERIATQRLQAREQSRPQAQMPDHTEAIHLSELEIDVSMPFVRRITMRNMTAWQNGPAPQTPQPELAEPSSHLGRKIGFLGVSSALVLGLGLLARRVGPFSGAGASIIDVAGKPKP